MTPDNDDWFAVNWGDIQHVFRYFRIAPPTLTVGTVRDLVDDLVALRAEAGGEPDLFGLEEVIDKHQAQDLSLWSAFGLLNACADVPANHDPTERSAIEYIPLAEMGRVLGRHIGRLEPYDVVELAGLAHEAGDRVNVFVDLLPSTVTARVSARGLRALKIKELRVIMERLSAGPLGGAGDDAA